MELAHSSFKLLHGGCRFQYGGHYQISFVSWSSFSNLSLSLVMSPLLKKERAWAIYIYIYISLYMLHFCDVWCIMNFISRDQILTKSPGLVTFIIWSCDLHCIYIAQFCAFNARSCDLYRLILWLISPYLPDLVTYMYIALYCDLHVYRLILWPISPDLVLYHLTLWPLSSSCVTNIYRLNLWTLSPALMTYIPNIVSSNSRSCDLYHPVVWQVSSDP